MRLTPSQLFNRNIRGFLGANGISRSGKKVARTQASSSDEIKPIDAIFSMVSDGETSSPTGFESVTRQLLAADVLDSLIQIQAEIASDAELPALPVKSRVLHAYHAAENADSYASDNDNNITFGN